MICFSDRKFSDDYGNYLLLIFILLSASNKIEHVKLRQIQTIKTFIYKTLPLTLIAQKQLENTNLKINLLN